MGRAMTDEPDWITKRDAATLAEVDERTIERKARAGKIDSRGRPGFPTRYWRADVEKLRQTAAQEVRTGLVEAVQASPASGNGAIAHQRTRVALFEEVMMDVLHAWHGALTNGATGPTVSTVAPTGPTATTSGGPTAPTPRYVDRVEALAIAGVSDEELRKAVKAGEVKVRGRKYRVKDLEAL